MTGYNIVNLDDMIEMLGEDETQKQLSVFSCPLNLDVEYFLKHLAISFAKQGWAKTHIVFASHKGLPTIIGYYTLAPKTIMVGKTALSNTLKKKIQKFGSFNGSLKQYIISAPLIAQLGKNYASGVNTLITGDELLKLACDRVSGVQADLGGRFVFLECEDVERLKDFYSRNGFVNFGNRPLDPDETNIKGQYLVQMLKYLKSPIG